MVNLNVKHMGKLNILTILNKAMLIGPQIRHLKKQIEESVSIPVDTIAPQYYGMMNGKGVFKEIEKKYNL